ncbi:MAG: hypothetical protein PF549_04185 [Patescibacteria group bacterium]|nr:hypothetical protein [Patescibacteria group bacterium]
MNFDTLDQNVKILDGLDFENKNKIAAEEQITEMLQGYPMEKMIPALMKEDLRVAAFVVSIAKKESNWGKRVPVLNGEDCFNYWGYRGGGEKVTHDNYTCFDTPDEAVQVISARISELVVGKDLNSPAKMIVWKCGSSCAGHSSEGVRKWIADVSLYFNKIVK